MREHMPSRLNVILVAAFIYACPVVLLTSMTVELAAIGRPSAAQSSLQHR